MEKDLKLLFDYQKLKKNKKLDDIIQKYPGGSIKKLSYEDLSQVSAAGDIYLNSKKLEKK